MTNLPALLTITPIGNGKELTYFYEYKGGNDIEVGWESEGRGVAALSGRYEILAKSKGMELIVKTLPIQTVRAEAVEESGARETETGKIVD